MQIFKYIVAAFLAASILVFSGVTVGAQTASQNKDYYLIDSYPYSQNIAKTFETEYVSGSFGSYGTLEVPQDFCIGEDGFLYVLDSGNSRILVMDSALVVKREIVSKFSEPGGICVAGGKIYVADTGNGRVVRLNSDGKVDRVYTQPMDEAYDSEYEFRPTRVDVDSNGKIYLLNKMDYHGLIALDADGLFMGYIGTTRVKTGYKERLLRIFATGEQREQIARSTPAYLTGFDISDKNLIYAVSNWESKNQLKILTPAGKNILPEKFYGEENSNINYGMLPAFKDVAVDKNGIAYACDSAQNKIYVYDSEGNSLSVFGSQGSRRGCFSAICAVEVDDSGRLYALDSTTGVIQIFAPTEVMRNISQASALYNDGCYEEAVKAWEKVTEKDATHYLANLGIAKAEQQAGNFDAAMRFYKNADSKTGYSDAFSQFRLNTVRKYFVFVALTVAFVIAVLLYLFKKAYIKSKKIDGDFSFTPESHGVKYYLFLVLLVLFHPIDTFDRLRRSRKSLKLFPAAVMFIALTVSRLVYVLILHFPFTPEISEGTDLLQQITVFLIPLVCFSATNYLVTTVMNGEQTATEAVYGTLYATIPYTLFSIPISLFSNILTTSESGLYNFIYYGLLLWSAILLLCSIYRMNGYSFGKFIAVTAVTLFAMACFAVVTFLIGLVIYQLVRFISELAVEAAFISVGV